MIRRFLRWLREKYDGGPYPDGLDELPSDGGRRFCLHRNVQVRVHVKLMTGDAVCAQCGKVVEHLEVNVREQTAEEALHAIEKMDAKFAAEPRRSK